MGYEGTRIYIMQFGWSFQYLFAWNGEIWQDRIVVKPNWWMYVLYFLKLVITPYSSRQLDQSEEIVLSGAMKTIDRLKDPSVQKEIKEAKRKADEKIKSQCLWQVRTFDPTKDEKCYYCLKHDKFVPIVEDKIPKHN